MLKIVLLALTSSFVWPGGNYVDRKHSFEWRVPAGYLLRSGSDTLACIEYNPEASVCFQYPPKRFLHTNFASAFINIKIRNARTGKACTEAADPDYRLDPKLPIKIIDRVEFRHTFRGGAAAGTDTDFDRYSGFEQGKCFEITVTVSQHTFADYEIPAIKEFTRRDAARVTAELNEIVASFHALRQRRL